MRRSSSIATAVLCGLCLSLGTGCGPSGAVTPTDVVLKPKDSGTATEPGSKTGPDGGTTPGPKGSGGAGTFKGRIVFDGAAPNLAPVAAGVVKPEEAPVCKVDVIGNESVVVGAGGGLANVFVYLDKKPSGYAASGPAPDAVKFDNKDCRFVPHALVVRTGQTVQVTNSDPIAHNTHTFPVKNAPFSSVVKVNDSVGLSSKYDQPESLPVEVKCDFHTWMRAYHLPLDHPFAAVTKEDGTFEIPGLPAGTYKFRIWHEKAGVLERGYEVRIDGDKDVGDIKFAASKFARFEGLRPKVLLLGAVP
jgi:plastocyanin